MRAFKLLKNASVGFLKVTYGYKKDFINELLYYTRLLIDFFELFNFLR